MSSTTNASMDVTSQQSSGEDSSKSTTSKKSKEAALEKKESDFEKDNASSPIDLECHIQEERITKILDEAVYKTRLALCVPKLVEDFLVLSSTLTTQHLDDLMFIYEQYDNPLFSPSLLNMAAMEDIKAGDLSLRNRLNPELGHLLYILNEYPSLKEVVDDIIEEIKLVFMTYGGAPIPFLEYLMAFESFKEILMKRMNTTAAEELGEKLRIRKLEQSDSKLIAKIKELTHTIKDEQEKFDSNMKTKKKMIEDLEAELVLLEEAAKAKLQKKVLDSDRHMVVMSRQHAARDEMLKEEEVDTRVGYNNLLNRHLIEEKAQRTRRFKVETQLYSWLQKYDLEMTDKQYELDELERRYEDEKLLCEQLETKVLEQEAEWGPLMKEREDEYHAEMASKLREFAIDHAARVIQKAWIQVLANRKEKRRLRALLKKVKKERDRLQRIADLKEEKERKEAEKAEKAAKKAAKKGG